MLLLYRVCLIYSKDSDEMSDQLFVEVTRNNVVESQHFGSAVVCDYKSNVIHSWGDIEKLMFPRSAL